MKITCELCGDNFDGEDCKLNVDEGNFIIECPNGCEVFWIHLGGIPDLTIED